MRTTIVTAVAALLVTLAAPLTAQTLNNRAQTTEQTRAFMASSVAGDIRKAYQGLRPYLGVDATPYDKSAEEAAAYFRQVTEKVGKPIGSTHVKTETIANDFIRETWLQKFPAAAIAWHFTFYQPGENGWKLVGISYSTDISDLYQISE
jgi:hypothetical protein